MMPAIPPAIIATINAHSGVPYVISALQPRQTFALSGVLPIQCGQVIFPFGGIFTEIEDSSLMMGLLLVADEDMKEFKCKKMYSCHELGST